MKKTIKILHVDDSYLDRILVRDILSQESSDFVIKEAETRDKFESLIAEQEFDIILSDFNILGFDGLQVLEIVKNINPNLPVIIVTGTGSEEVAIQAMKMGASDYVIKSVKHIKSLPHAIRSVLEYKQKEIELEKIQNELLKSEALFRTAFENAAIGVCLVDKKGSFINVNETFCKIVGYSKSELINSNINKLTHPEDIQKSIDFMTYILEGTNNFANFEKRYIHKNGNLIWVNISTSLIKNCPNEPEYFFSYVQDISEKKKFEEELILAKNKAEEADHLKTAFLNNISHEIRTPMNAIIGFSELLKETDIDNKKHEEYTNTIIQSSELLLSIISDILSISTIEAGQEKIHITEFNLNEMLNLLYDQFKIKTDQMSLNFKIVKTISDKEAIVTSDKTKLIQIISNLLNNSIKFTTSGFIEVSSFIRESKLYFSVKDSGIGIPANMHEEIFKRFRQIESSSDRYYGGSGLGLAITKAYVELLDGQIWLESEPDKGTTFYFTIPYVTQTKKGKILSLAKAVDTLTIKENVKTILIAEVDDSNFLLLKTFLSESVENIIRVKTGYDAVETCKKNTDIDLILMDIKMPKENGLVAIKKIREFNKQIPIIIESAYFDNANKEEAFASGCNDFITKPIKKDALINSINKLFE